MTQAPRLLLVLESATWVALAMASFSGFVMGACAAALLFDQLCGRVILWKAILTRPLG